MEAFDDPTYGTIVAVMGSQMGKTEGLFNVLGKRFDDGPYTPALYIGPTQKQVKSISRDRIGKMIRSTPSLYEKLEKGQPDQLYEKWISGVRLGFGWAGSATELASHPAGLVVVDEYSRMDMDVNGEGDPYTLAKARTKNYPAGKVAVVSTPTIEGADPTVNLFDDGTKLFWAWPCPECGDLFVPKIELLWWPEKSTPGEALRAARLICPDCGAQIEGRFKHQMNKAGQYIPHEKTANGDYIPAETDPPPNSIASFWVSGIASPWQSFGQVAEMLLSAYRSGEPERIQAAINTYGGELYKTRGDAPKPDEVEALKLDYEPGSLPVGVQLITAGVDVQKDGLYYVIRGWGFNLESWLIGSGFIPGLTEYDDVWVLLNRQLSVHYENLIIRRMFIDSGYRPGDKHRRPDNQIYLFCRKTAGRAYPTKGHDQQDRPLKASRIDVSISGKMIKNGVQLWHVDSDYFKTWLYSRIRWPEGEPGGWHLHSKIDPDYCAQIVSEELIVKPSGRRIWIRRNKANHYLDCEVLAAAAAFAEQVHTLPPLPGPGQPTGPVIPKDNRSFVRGPRKGPLVR